MRHGLSLFFLVFVWFSVSQQLSDPHRPQIHALPPSNWINDPNGPIYYMGQYHLFFQYNPDAAVWGNITWGHMQSPDMIHWEWKGIALSPGNSIKDADHAGCWTGSAVIDITGSQKPTILYTGVRFPDFYETQMIAVASDDNITQWDQSSTNPVIRGPPRNELPGKVSGFRDPAFWYDNTISKWRLFIGSGVENIGGYILQYQAEKLEGPWTYIKPLIIGNETYHGDMWECPDFFQLSSINGKDSKWVLLFGDDGLQRNYYMIGDFDEENNIFIPDPAFLHARILDAGNFYACKTMLDSNSNSRILWGWSPEDRAVEVYSASGWAGVQTLPRVLYLSNDLSTLVFSEVDSLTNLSHTNATSGNQLDIRANFTIQSSNAPVGVRVLQSSNSAEYTLISYSPSSRMLSVDRTYSSLSPAVNHSIISSLVYFPDSVPINQLSLRVIVDHSIVEVIANSVTCITARVYPTLSDSIGVQFMQTPMEFSITELSSIYQNQKE